MKGLLLIMSLVLITTSCGKWKDEKNKNLVYYSEDFKDKNMTLLDVSTSEIDVLWFEFARKENSKEYEAYTLILKANGETFKETGTCEIDWKNQITFTPVTGEAYIGEWVSEKKKFVISYDLETRTEEITFVYKEADKCW